MEQAKNKEQGIRTFNAFSVWFRAALQRAIKHIFLGRYPAVLLRGEVVMNGNIFKLYTKNFQKPPAARLKCDCHGV